MMQLAGAVVVVTGTSSGLGRRLALDLADGGAQVTALARRASLQEELDAELRRRSAGSSAQAFDVSDTEAYRHLLEEIEQRQGRIDILINNAAAFEPPGPPTVEGFRTVMETNFFASVTATLAVLPGMRQRRRGVVVNVSSDIARAPLPGEAAYGSSKAALSAFTESLSYAASADGVSLHVLYPAYIPRGEDANASRSLGQRLVTRTDEQVSRLVLSRMGSNRVDLDAAYLPRLAPAFRAVAPGLFRRMAPAAGTNVM